MCIVLAACQFLNISSRTLNLFNIFAYPSRVLSLLLTSRNSEGYKHWSILYWAYSLQPLFLTLSTQISYCTLTTHPIGFKPGSGCSYHLSLERISTFIALEITSPFCIWILFPTGDISARQLFLNNLESKMGQDLIANLVDIQTGSMAHFYN